ncbi:MFS transporter [Hydrogenivirga sp. 128-5-R1-1]|uniref:MFS transporter n=1 Tax=Hydrogenivirga sp. 128-5-R1-1 TaxID=392423 RepID=UPI00015F3331|nr:major facilitator family transporter [Hydrogenivirga sp. 128-5-R1-1]
MSQEIPIYQKISTGERALITFIVMSGAFMAILDTTIVDIIVPKITAPLQTDFYGVQWVITAYMIASATMLILAEWLDKNFGLKKFIRQGGTFYSFIFCLWGI